MVSANIGLKAFREDMILKWMDKRGKLNLLLTHLSIKLKPNIWLFLIYLKLTNIFSSFAFQMLFLISTNTRISISNWLTLSWLYYIKLINILLINLIFCTYVYKLKKLRPFYLPKNHSFSYQASPNTFLLSFKHSNILKRLFLLPVLFGNVTNSHIRTLAN